MNWSILFLGFLSFILMGRYLINKKNKESNEFSRLQERHEKRGVIYYWNFTNSSCFAAQPGKSVGKIAIIVNHSQKSLF
jgi:hypothetical protein